MSSSSSARPHSTYYPEHNLEHNEKRSHTSDGPHKCRVADFLYSLDSSLRSDHESHNNYVLKIEQLEEKPVFDVPIQEYRA